MKKQAEVNINVKFRGDKILCARSPENCRGCKDKNKCENIDFSYEFYQEFGQTLADARIYKKIGGRYRQVKG